MLRARLFAGQGGIGAATHRWLHFQHDEEIREMNGGPLPAVSWKLHQIGTALAVIAIFIAIFIRQFFDYNTDVATLIVYGEKLLAHEGLYTDIIEVNPPGAILIYVPAVWLGRAFGVFPEIMIEPLVFLLFFISLAASHFILTKSRLISREHAPWLGVLAILVFAIMPMGGFAEREAIGAIVLLPLLSWVAARCAGQRMGGWSAVAAGIGLCLALMCKPFFVFAILAVALYQLWRTRSFAMLFDMPWLVGGALTIIYFLSVVIFFRPYLTDDVMLAVLQLYAAGQRSLAVLAQVPSFSFWILPALFTGISLFFSRIARKQEIAPVFLLASMGAMAAYFVQGKGWSYHAYPALAFILIASGQILIAQPLSRHVTIARKCFVAAILFLAIYRTALWMDIDLPRHTREIASSISKISSKPKIAYIGNETAIYPLMRLVSGEQVLRSGSLALTYIAHHRLQKETAPQRIAKLKGLLERDRRMFLQDVAARRPNIVLMDNDRLWTQWAASDPDVVRFLSGYVRADQIGNLIIMKKRVKT